MQKELMEDDQLLITVFLAGSYLGFFKMNLDIFLISFFAYLLVPVLMIAKGKKATN
ncbi:hypothetical protein OA320_03295 [Prochlorococcus sp. AH-716-O10]|nr:hypothetical protein [Prochlorococcus sp. AH-716-O10]